MKINICDEHYIISSNNIHVIYILTLGRREAWIQVYLSLCFRTVRMLLELLHVLDLAGSPPGMVSYYCLFCSVLVLLGQFVFNKWKGLSSVPSLYPIPVDVVSPSGVNEECKVCHKTV